VISTSAELEPRHWGLTSVERRDRGRRVAALFTLLALLFHVAHVVPTGRLWPVVTFAAFLTLLLLPVWLVGFVHAVGALRAHGGGAARAALCWWLFPWVVGLATWGGVESGLAQRASLALVADDLEELLPTHSGSPGTLISIEDRFVGPYPCRDLRRYPSGALRLEFVGAGALDGARGLVHLPEGVPLPVGLEATGAPVLGTWVPWLEERL